MYLCCASQSECLHGPFYCRLSRTSFVLHDIWLQIGEIHNLLDAANIDYRDCFERQELVARLQSAEGTLPPHVKAGFLALMRMFTSAFLQYFCRLHPRSLPENA